MPKCHLPTSPVLYPASLSTLAKESSERGKPVGTLFQIVTRILELFAATPYRMGSRPVKKAALSKKFCTTQSSGIDKTLQFFTILTIKILKAWTEIVNICSFEIEIVLIWHEATFLFLKKSEGHFGAQMFEFHKTSNKYTFNCDCLH